MPPALDQVLRAKAREEGRSLNEVAIETLRRAMGLGEEREVQRSLRGIRGTWQEDEEFDAALRDQHQVDPDLWA